MKKTDSKTGQATTQSEIVAQDAQSVNAHNNKLSLVRKEVNEAVLTASKTDNGQSISEIGKVDNVQSNPSVMEASGHSNQLNSSITGITIEGILDEESPEIHGLTKEIGEYIGLKIVIEQKIKGKKNLLKYNSRAQKKLKGKLVAKLTSEQRISLEVEVARLESKLIWVKEHIEHLQNRLNTISAGELKKLNIQKLYDNANSKLYTKRNKYSIKKKIISLFNDTLSGQDMQKKVDFLNVRNAAFKRGEDSEKEFNDSFAEFLQSTDIKVYILCSGKLKSELYESARLTLQNFNARDSVIKKLVTPEDLKEKEKTESDPLLRNKGLISVRLIDFLNANLKIKEKKEKLLKLGKQAKNSNLQPFLDDLDSFIFDDDESIYVLCSGELKSKLFEAFRLTLKNWDSKTKFTEIIFPQTENN